MSEQQIHTENLFKVFASDASNDSKLMRTVKEYLPNSLTVTRVALAFAFPALPHDLRLVALVIAALTEWLDGALSRLWSVESKFGQLLDPVADKLFIVVMLATFAWEGFIVVPAVALVLLRDATVAIACVLILAFGERSELSQMKPRILGKVATAFQFALLLTLVLTHGAPLWLIVATGVLSALAALDYVRIYFGEIRGSSKANEPAPTH